MSDPIKEYKKNGKKYYQFQVYTGINPKTGKKAKTRRRGFKTKSAAKQAIKDIENQVLNGSYYEENNFKKQRFTLTDVFNEWYDIRKLSVTGSTLISYKVCFQRLEPIKHYHIKQITSKDITNILHQYMYLSQSSMDAMWNLLNQLFDFALNSEYIRTNPMKRINKPKINAIKEQFTNFYTEDELMELLVTLKEYDFMLYVMCRLMGCAGLRAGEVGALMWKDINFDKGTIYVNKTLAVLEDGRSVVSAPKTKASTRLLSIDKNTIEALKALKHITGHQEFVFESKRKDATLIKSSAIGNRLRRFFKKIPNLRPITPHGLRHTHASILFRQGVPPKVVQQRLGHETVEMTLNVYIHVMPEDNEEIIGSFLNNINF